MSLYSLLSHFNGTQDQTSYTASNIGESGQTFTFIGSAKLDSTQAKFGSTALYVPGSSTSQATIPDATEWEFGSGNFTLDCWAYLNESVNASTWPINTFKLMASLTATLNTWNLSNGSQWGFYPYAFSDGTISLVYGYTDITGNLAYVSSSSPINIAQNWHHFAVTRSSNTLRLFVDGTKVGERASAPAGGTYIADVNRRLRIGQLLNSVTFNANNWKGWIDEVRISKGIAAWTSDFTPPTIEYGPIINVQPVDSTVAFSGSSTLSVDATGTSTLHYGWKRDGTSVGTDSSALSLVNFSDSSRGIYQVTVTSSTDGTTLSNPVRVISKPTITYQPDSFFCNYGNSYNLEVFCDGYTPVTYQWYKDRTSITDATNRIFTISNYSDSSSGLYNVIATASEGGSVTSGDSTVKTKQQTLLVHFDGTQNQNSYTAESGQSLTFVGTAKIDTTQLRFGTSSLYLDGGAGNYVTVPDSTDWQFGSNDYIVDCWVYLNEAAGTNRNIMMYSGTTPNAYNTTTGIIWNLYISGRRLTFRHLRADNTSAFYDIQSQSNYDISYGWHHVAVMRNTTNTVVFLDGVCLIYNKDPAFIGVTPAGVAAPTSGAHSLYIGLACSVAGQVTNNWKGWIDEVRIWKGRSPWTWVNNSLSFDVRLFYSPSFQYSFRPGPEHYYINAEATVQDGLTPSTGYNDFLALFMNRGLAQDDWTVDVVATNTTVKSMGYDPILCGIVKAYIPGTYPVVEVGPGVFYLKSDTTVRGLKLIITADFGFGRRSMFMSAYIKGTKNVLIDSCKAENYRVGTNLFLAGGYGGNVNPFYSVTIQNSTFWKVSNVWVRGYTYAQGQKLVYVNNSIVGDAVAFLGGQNLGAGQSYLVNIDLYIYNNYVTGLGTPYATIFVDTVLSRAKGYIDRFYYHQQTFFPPFINSTVNITLGSSGDLTNTFPAVYPSPDTTNQIAITNKNFAIPYSSPLKNLGVANTYTPSVDIRGLPRDATYDVGAYEYIPIIINSQPTDQRVPNGDTLTFSVDATGTATLHYQWKKDGTNVGTDSSVYTATNFSDTSRGRYNVTLSCIDSTNADGTHYLTSNEAVAAGQWYINAGSSTQNGFTPSTGFRNFTDLVASHGNLSPLDTVDIVYSGIDATDSTQIILNGLIRPYASGTFPTISNTIGTLYSSYLIGNDATVTGLTIKGDTSSISRTVFLFDIDGTNANIYGNKIQYTNNVDTNDNPIIINASSHSNGLISFQNNSVWIKTVSTANNLNILNSQTVDYTSGINKFVVSNNSFYVDASTSATFSMQALAITKHQLFSYNNIFSFERSTDSTSWIYSCGTVPDFAVQDYDLTYNFNGTLGTGNITTGSHNITGDPLFKDATNKDLSILKTSPAVNAAASNLYTTPTDIRGQVKTFTNDIGAYGLAAPIITAQPTPPAQNVSIGSNLLIHVDATSYDPLHYQWKKDGYNVGTDSSDYSKTYANIDSGIYNVNVVVNDLTATSNNVSIFTATTFINQPLSQSVKIDYSCTLDASAIGQAPLTFKWYKNGALISGAIGQTLSLTPYADSSRGVYKAVIINGIGKDLTSNDATITSALDIVINPLSRVAVLGDNIELSVAATGKSPLAYQWYHDSTPIGTNSYFLTLNNYSDSSKGDYFVTVTNSDGTITSNSASIYTNQRTFYLNAESVTQDGSTAATGYHNFSSLISSQGALRKTDVVRVAYSGSNILDTSRIILAGSIRPDVTGTFPIIVNALSTDHGYDIQSDTIITGLNIKADTTNYSKILIRFDGTNTTLYGNKISHNCTHPTEPPTTMFDTTKATGPISIKNNSIWIRSAAGGVGASYYPISLQAAAWNVSNVASIANNSFYIECTVTSPVNFQGVISASHRCFNYNNIYYSPRTLSSVALIHSSAPLQSYEDYNTRYNFTGNYLATNGNDVLGTHPFTFAPRYRDATNKDLSILSSSPIINLATTNVFTTTSDILGRQKILTQDLGAYRTDSTFIPGEWYINNSSISQDGTTPTTGYRNFSGLLSKIDQFISADSVYVVYTGVDTTDSGSINLAGKISSYTPRTFPAILNANGSYILGSDTTINGLTLKTDQVVNTNFLQFNGPRSAIIGNKIIHRSNHSNTVVVITANSPTAGMLTVQNNSIWSKATTPSTFYQILSSSFSITTDSTWNLTNNSFYIDFTSSANAQTLVSTSHRLFSYNNIFYFKNGSPFNMYNVNTNAFYTSYDDYNLRYGFTGTYCASGVLNVGSHDAVADPLYRDGTGGNLALQKNSPAANAAGTNAYTPSTDIWGLSKTYSNDIGAFEVAYPVITSQPISQKLVIGNTLTLTSDATSYDGTAVHYQWKKDGTNVGSDSTIYSKIYADIDRGVYRLYAIANDRTSMSFDATITTQPIFVTQPISQSFELNSSAYLDTSVSGHIPISYQWYKGGVVINGATSSTLNLAPFSDSSRGVYKVVALSDGYDTTSLDATLTVKPTITLQPISQKFEVGAPAYLYTSAIGHAPINYQWYKDNTSLFGQTDATLNLSPFAESKNGTYKVTVTSDGNTVDSSNALIVSNITITTIPGTIATQGIPYSYYPSAVGAVISHWELTGAPVGMLFDSTTGAINWTPSYDQTSSGPLRLTVFDDSTDFQDWTITVTAVSQGKAVTDPGKIYEPVGGKLFLEIPSNRLVIFVGGLPLYV